MELSINRVCLDLCHPFEEGQWDNVRVQQDFLGASHLFHRIPGAAEMEVTPEGHMFAKKMQKNLFFSCQKSFRHENTQSCWAWFVPVAIVGLSSMRC